MNSITSQDPIDLTGGSMSIAASSTINSSVTVSGGTLTVTGPLALNGLFSLGTGSTLSGSGTVAAYGGLGFGGPNTLDGVTLNNYATATLTRDAIEFAHGAVFNNEANATFDSQIDGAIGSVGNLGTFNNAGTFTKSAGTGITAVGVPFNNTGTASVATGTLSFQRGGVSTGPFTGAGGTSLDFQGDHSLSGAVSGDTVTFGSNTIDGDQAVTVSGPYSAATATSLGDPVADSFRGTTVHFTGPVAGAGTYLSATVRRTSARPRRRP